MVEPTSNATPSATSWNPGHVAVIVVAVVHGHRDLPVVAAQGPLQRREHVRITGESREPPVALERLPQALQVTARVGEIGLAHLHVVQPHDRIDLDRMRVGLLAHDLPMQLALRRHVDDEVARDARMTPEAPVGGQARSFAVAGLGLAERGEMVRHAT